MRGAQNISVAQRLLPSKAANQYSPTPHQKYLHEEKQISETPYCRDLFNGRLRSPAFGGRFKRTDQGWNPPFFIGHHGHLGDIT